MKIRRCLPFLAAVFCTIATNVQAAPLLPELQNKILPPRQISGREIAVNSYCFEQDNLAAMGDLFHRSVPAEQRELQRRMGDPTQRWELRLLYAAVLAIQKNAAGRQFLIEQADKTNPDRLADVYSTIHLVWQYDFYLNTNRKSTEKYEHSDMAWAEDMMLKALADKRSCCPKLLYPWDKNYKELVRRLAVEYGEFPEILAQRKCVKAVPVLCDYLKADMAAAPADQSFCDYRAVQVARSLFTFDDPAIEATAVAVADKSLDSAASWYQATRDAFQWLVKREKASAIPLILKGLSQSEKGGFIAGNAEEFYGVLVGTKHQPYLDAVRSLLPALLREDGPKDSDSELRRRTMLAYAQLILLMADEKDPVPKLMEFVSNPKNENRGSALGQLERLKDPRAVAWAKRRAETETGWSVVFDLIRLLGNTPGDEATEALVSLLECRFDLIAPEKDIHYTVKDYHKNIVQYLELRTGFRLPPDAATWREWLQKRDADGRPVVPLRRALVKRHGPPDRSDHDGNYFHYDLPSGEVRTLILEGEKLLGEEVTKKTNLKSQVGKRVTIVGEYEMDIDGYSIYTPDGQDIHLSNQKDLNIPSNSFVSVTGVLQRGGWGFFMDGELELKTLYSPKSELEPPDKPPAAQQPADCNR